MTLYREYIITLLPRILREIIISQKFPVLYIRYRYRYGSTKRKEIMSKDLDTPVFECLG